MYDVVATGGIVFNSDVRAAEAAEVAAKAAKVEPSATPPSTPIKKEEDVAASPNGEVVESSTPESVKKKRKSMREREALEEAKKFMSQKVKKMTVRVEISANNS